MEAMRKAVLTLAVCPSAGHYQQQGDAVMRENTGPMAAALRRRMDAVGSQLAMVAGALQ